MMHRRASVLLTIAVLGNFPSLLRGSNELTQGLNRIFASTAFEEKAFGPARWIKGGTAFTTLEPSGNNEGAKDIVEYDTATGKRTVLISASELKPPQS